MKEIEISSHHSVNPKILKLFPTGFLHECRSTFPWQQDSSSLPILYSQTVARKHVLSRLSEV
jgi:hypothetical protein